MTAGFEPYYLLPLSAGLLYAVAALLLKRVSGSNLGITRTLCISNWMMGLLFFGIFFLQREPVDWALWYAPILAAATFFLGQLFTFIAIRAGDVSVVTPLLGTKVVFVGLCAVILTPEPPDPLVWAGAVLTALAVFLLGVGDFRGGRGTGPAILATLASAAFFGLTDALVQKWAREMGSYAFISTMFVTVAVLSFGLIPLFRGKLREIDGWAWPWLLAGTAILAVQALLLALALGLFGHATTMNILYSSRGLWSILLVLSIGPLIGNLERNAGTRILILRTSGVLLLTLAIILVLQS